MMLDVTEHPGGGFKWESPVLHTCQGGFRACFTISVDVPPTTKRFLWHEARCWCDYEGLMENVWMAVPGLSGGWRREFSKSGHRTATVSSSVDRVPHSRLGLTASVPADCKTVSKDCSPRLFLAGVPTDRASMSVDEHDQSFGSWAIRSSS